MLPVLINNRYRPYIVRVFWNSLFAVLSALVLILIVIYGWQGLQAVMERMDLDRSDPEPDDAALDQVRLLESLRGEDTVSAAEKARLLEELQTGESADGPSDEEQRALLESLRASP